MVLAAAVALPSCYAPITPCAQAMFDYNVFYNSTNPMASMIMFMWVALVLA